ncbi:MAG: DNA-binding protein WhiA [Clostridia bacterium]|nr:DNA-binding protein WhiA [Clostridia bacterium]
MELSFSQSVRQELIKQIPKGLSERQALIAGFFCTGRTVEKLPFSTSVSLSTERAEYLEELLRLVSFKFISRRSMDSDTKSITIAEDSLDDFINCFSMCFTPTSADQLSSSLEFRRNFLKATFISCGYCADPNKTYRVELHIKNSRAVDLIIWMLHANDIEPSVSLKDDTTIIRFRNGDSISTFLALVGAVKSMLEFENIRAKHEVNSRVQREVNCDLGNAKRKADAGARRTELFIKLLNSEERSKLPKELLEAALVLINNPGLSIAELGRLMDPPISKSGMNHRLIKLEELANSLE